MSFRNKYLYIIVALIALVGLVQQFSKSLKGEDDYSFQMLTKPTGKKESIVVKFIPRNCECPQWVRIGDTTSFFYLEADSFDLPDPDILAGRQDNHTQFRLEGAFLKSNGLPEGYNGDASKGVIAPVFKYSALETLNTEEED